MQGTERAQMVVFQDDMVLPVTRTALTAWTSSAMRQPATVLENAWTGFMDYSVNKHAQMSVKLVIRQLEHV